MDNLLWGTQERYEKADFVLRKTMEMERSYEKVRESYGMSNKT